MSDVQYESTGEVGAGGQIDPIHVVIDGKTEPPENTPEFGSWQTVSWPALTTPQASAQQLLPEARKRYEAQIVVIGSAGSGGLVEQNPANPAAGTNFTFVNNTGQTINLVSIRGTFTADAVVANRNISLQILDPAGNVVAVTPNNASTVASTSLVVNGVVGGSILSNASGNCVLPIPITALPPGWQVRLAAAGIDPGDTWTGIFLSYTTTGAFVRIGSMAQVLNNGGGQIQFGTRIPYHSAQPVWVASDGVNAATVLVLDERYL